MTTTLESSLLLGVPYFPVLDDLLVAHHKQVPQGGARAQLRRAIEVPEQDARLVLAGFHLDPNPLVLGRRLVPELSLDIVALLGPAMLGVRPHHVIPPKTETLPFGVVWR